MLEKIVSQSYFSRAHQNHDKTEGFGDYKICINMAANSDNIFATLQQQLSDNEKQKIKQLDQKKLAADEADKRLLQEREEKLQQAYQKGDQTQIQELAGMAKLSAENEEYIGEMNNLVVSLNGDLTQWGVVIGDLANYQGLESYISKVPLLGEKLADRLRDKRVSKVDLQGNLETILTYSAFTVQRLGESIMENMGRASDIQRTVDEAVVLLTENQPLYEKWRKTGEDLVRERDKVKDLQDHANETDFPKYAAQLADLDKQVRESKINETHYFGVVETTKQAIPVQKGAYEALMNTVESLEDMRTRLDNKIRQVTTTYAGAPTIVKTQLRVRAFSQIDKGMNYATTKTLEVYVHNANEIGKERMSRAERELVEPETLYAIQEVLNSASASIREREEARKAHYAAPNK